MDSLLVQLVPLILGAILAPVWVIIVLLLLSSQRGLLKASAFVLGMTTIRLLQGLVFGIIFASSPDNVADSSGATPVVSTLLLVVGILLFIMAYYKWRKADDFDEPPKWQQAFEQISVAKAFGLGALFVAIGIKLWVFTLSAISIISAAALGQTTGIVVYVLYVLLAQSLLIIAILVALVPGAASLLKQAMTWLTRYNRPISIGVGLIFGVYFSYKGISGLLS